MDIKRTVTILLPDDADLRATVAAFQLVQQDLSEPCHNHGAPLSALALHHAMYASVAGTLNSQMTCSAIRLTAGAYASARSNRHEIERPFAFRRARALFLVGKRGRDADFRADGMLSIWTVAGRKRLSYVVPDTFQATLATAKEIDSLTVIERDGRLIGRVTLTLDAPEPQGVQSRGGRLERDERARCGRPRQRYSLYQRQGRQGCQQTRLQDAQEPPTQTCDAQGRAEGHA